LDHVVDFILGDFTGGENITGWMYVWMEVSGAIGTILRNFGIIIGIVVLGIMISKSKRFEDVKKWVGLALFIEAFYYFMVGFPSGVFMTTVGYGGAFVTLGISYLLQFLSTVPFLIILGLKVTMGKYKENGFRLWVGFAFVGYVLALGVNSMFRWFDMISAEGFSVFFSGIRAFGVLNALVLMPLAIFFSVFAAFRLINKKKTAYRWLGLALFAVGLHYLLYVVYSYFGGMLAFVLLVEVWTIPLIGLGVSIIRNR
jgi:hypothetical protein